MDLQSPDGGVGVFSRVGSENTVKILNNTNESPPGEDKHLNVCKLNLLLIGTKTKRTRPYQLPGASCWFTRTVRSYSLCPKEFSESCFLIRILFYDDFGLSQECFLGGIDCLDWE